METHTTGGSQRATLQVKKLYELSILLGISVLVIQFVLGLNEPAARLVFSYVVLMMVAFASSLSFLRIGSISLTLESWPYPLTLFLVWTLVLGLIAMAGSQRYVFLSVALYDAEVLIACV